MTTNVVSAKPGGLLHLEEPGNYDTYCGRETGRWTFRRRADLTADIDSPVLCKKCRDVALR